MKIKKLNRWTISGLLFLSLGFVILLVTFAPLIFYEVSYSAASVVPNAKKEEVVPIDKDFGLVIPKINANAKIIPSVDPFNPSIYQNALAKGIAHAKGTALPGENGNIFLFSHSSADFLTATRYNSIFYLLSKLEPGDTVDIFYKETEYTYQVTDKKIVNSDAISYLKTRSKTETLTLMTCWPPGTSLKRLIVEAVPQESQK